ncbi:MAG: 4a-hydroxytetrahydrobiopterin dehydratase [Chloroflexota bacterium]
MSELSAMKCIPCRGGDPTVTEAQQVEYLKQVPNWKVIKVNGIQHLERIFWFNDFSQALAFTNQVGEIAESQDHHPALLTEWGRVTVTWWTHIIKGLHNNDFVSAAKVDKLADPENLQ